MTEHLEILLLAAFGLLILTLSQLRELLRQIVRTVTEWRRLVAALKRPEGSRPTPEEIDRTNHKQS